MWDKKLWLIVGLWGALVWLGGGHGLMGEWAEDAAGPGGSAVLAEHRLEACATGRRVWQARGVGTPKLGGNTGWKPVPPGGSRGWSGGMGRMGRMGRMGPIEAESESRVIGKLRATSCEPGRKRRKRVEATAPGSLFSRVTHHASRVIGKLRATSCEPGERKLQAASPKLQAQSSAPRSRPRTIRATVHATPVTRQEEGDGARAGGGPTGASAPFRQGRNRRKWGERAGVPPFFLKRGELGVREGLMERGEDMRHASRVMKRGAAGGPKGRGSSGTGKKERDRDRGRDRDRWVWA